MLNKYFTINQMPVVASTYWNNVFGRVPGDADGDAEGLATMRNIGKKHGLAPSLYRGRTGRRHQRTEADRQRPTSSGRTAEQIHERANFGTKSPSIPRRPSAIFKERRIKVQFIDLKEKEMSKGELTSVMQAVGGIDKLLNPKAKDEEMLALIQHLTPSQRFDKKLLENQQVLAEPIVRNGKRPPSVIAPMYGGAWGVTCVICRRVGGKSRRLA